jgi:cephalosporin-C deacetylase-like acetyl esterase
MTFLTMFLASWMAAAGPDPAAGPPRTPKGAGGRSALSSGEAKETGRASKPRGAPAGDMMKTYLLAFLNKAQAEWRRQYEERKTPEQISAYQARLRSRFVDAIGGFPERTPLNVRVVGTVTRPGYRVEKVLFDSQSSHSVTAALFLPDPERHRPPYPGVIVPCGHSANGKAMDVYQRACALAALNGIAALIFDPIDQGERHQLIEKNPKARLAGTAGHNMVAAGSILLGRSTARWEIWDGMRSIDYLQSRSDIDPRRIGCMGNSGGGTQTAYLMALDDRIAAASPSCYLCSLYGRLIRNYEPQDSEQNIFGQLAWGMDHADYVMMRAPRPTLMCTATRDFFNITDAWAAFRDAKRLYTRMGFPERVSLIEADESHGYSLHLRQGAVRWMMRWLLQRDEAVTEPSDMKILTEEEIRCTPGGDVLLLPGQRSVYDLNRDYDRESSAHRRHYWDSLPRAEWLKRVREMADIRPAGALPPVRAEKVGTESAEGCRIDRYILIPEEGIFLPALMFVPQASPTGERVLYIHPDGKEADRATLLQMAASGRMVLSVDLRGIGETQSPQRPYFAADRHGRDAQDFYTAYLLGRCLVGMRAEDILACAGWLRQVQPSPVGGCLLQLTAIGHLGVTALHAAALEPDVLASVRLVRPLVSWSSVVELGYVRTPYSCMVHGALTFYDLPDLVRSLGDQVTMEQPVDAMGRPTGSPRVP